MPIPNKTLVAAWSKSQDPKYDFYLSQFVSKYESQFDITYLDDTTGPIYRQTLADIDPICLVHGGHGQPQAWEGREDDDPWVQILLHGGEHKDLITGRVGMSTACHTGEPDGLGDQWVSPPDEGIAYNGYAGFGQGVDPYDPNMEPYIEDWYWVECGTQDFFFQVILLHNQLPVKSIRYMNLLINGLKNNLMNGGNM